MTPNEKADRAREMLESEIFKVAFDDLRAGLVSKLEAAPFGDVAMHHEITLALQALNSVKTQFQRYISDAAIVQHNEKQDQYVRKMRQTLHGGG